MAEFKGLEYMNIPDDEIPNWAQVWGKEYSQDSYFLDHVYSKTHKEPLEYRNNVLRVLKDELIPLHTRFRVAFNDECNEAQELCEKFNKAETGVFNVILREYEEFMASLPNRYPELVPMIKDENNFGKVMFYGTNKVIGSGVVGGPTVVFNYGTALDYETLFIKGYQAMNARLFKKATLQEQQNQALARALEENGIQQPPECATIQGELDELKKLEVLKLPGPVEGDPCPDADPFNLIQQGNGSTFTGVFVNKKKRFVREKTPVIMYIPHVEELLDDLEAYDFSQIFLSAPTEKKWPGYSKVVKQHRDFSTIRHNIDWTGGYCPKGPFEDMRLMIDNYCHFFGKGSSQYQKALKLEQKLVQKLKNYGEAGETAKAHFDEAPRAEFNDASEPSDENDLRSVSDNDASLQQSEADNDNTVEVGDMDTSFAQNINDQYESVYGGEDRGAEYYNDQDYDSEDYGDEPEHRVNVDDEIFDNQDDRSREGSFINESSVFHGPSEPSADEENTIDRAFDLFNTAKQYDVDVGNATRPPVRHETEQPGASFSAQSPSPHPEDSEPDEQNLGEVSFFDKYSYVNPDSDGFAPLDEASADEAGDDTAHAGAHASQQPAPFAPMEAEPPVIDLTSSPQGHISHPGSASAKRTRTSDDQGSSDVDAPSVKRRKTVGKTPAHTTTTSLGKRSRSVDDGADEEEREQPSKRPRVASVPAQVFASTVPAAAQAGEPDTEARRQQIFGSLGVGLEQQQPQTLQQRLLQREDSLPPSPIPEPLTPVAAAADGPGGVSAEVPEFDNDVSDTVAQPEPATTALGHTDNGTITVTQLQKLQKYKKKARSKGRGTPNRPWVFGHRFGNDYGLYILGCPTKGCEIGGEAVRRNPLFDNAASIHLKECCGDFGGDDIGNMVRKFGKQVISDGKKALSTEWARNWNSELIKEYGNYDDGEMEEYNVF